MTISKRSPESFGQIIRRLLPRGILLKGIAHNAGISWNFFDAFLQGTRNGEPILPTEEMLGRIAEAMRKTGAEISDEDWQKLVRSIGGNPVTKIS